MSIYSPLRACYSGRQSRLQKYVFLPCNIYRRLKNPFLGIANYPVRLSTTSMMIRFSTYFIFFGRVCSKEKKLDLFTGTGAANAGGTSWPKFVGDGDASYLGQPLTLVSVSFVVLVLQWRTCWHIHLPFPLLLVTIVRIICSPQKMKREYCSHFSIAIV
jgi:hypothetical protein